jgi:hypothetical protein
MKNSAIITEAYKSNNRTYRMLISLLDKWQDKSYDLTDEEWSTIKSYKTILDLFFNDKSEIQKIIKANEEILAKI